jgi:hypothetical protein
VDFCCFFSWDGALLFSGLNESLLLFSMGWGPAEWGSSVVAVDCHRFSVVNWGSSAFFLLDTALLLLFEQPFRTQPLLCCLAHAATVAWA